MVDTLPLATLDWDDAYVVPAAGEGTDTVPGRVAVWGGPIRWEGACGAVATGTERLGGTCWCGIPPPVLRCGN